MPNILIIEDDVAFCKVLEKFLMKNGHEVSTSFSATEAKTKIAENTFDLIITDLRLPNYDGLDLLSEIKQDFPAIPVVLMTGYAEINTAVKAMKKGAFDYISKPFNPDEVLLIINKALKEAREKPSKKEAVPAAARQQISDTGERFVAGASVASRKLNQYIDLVGPTDMSVLIIGDSGTGKEVVAKAIHNKSTRKDQNFIAVDCGAIPREIAASEFFGHVKGSFTGAVNDKMGHFEAANGGTIFLDEVGNLSYENQIQLLRALQERKIKRIGSSKEIKVDIRLITATNEDLQAAVRKGDFREDLYHRLNEFSINVPSLSERKDDLMLFADHFLDLANSQLGKHVLGFSSEVSEAFENYSWPGNIRELQNVIKRATLLTTSEHIQKDALPQEIFKAENQRMDYSFFKTENEKELILNALRETNNNKSKAAELLKMNRKTLYNKLKLYKIDL
ncbi:sigma-54-dependent transcriptional regulator [Sinomicrobium weinanense]|uniref:Sigma-54-dependent Fis family transcriptional regulator n=1 Tax=Sinomicrobium weinanense TaxID=2842200 RepID=A0A926Q2X5_9FLAO|nr:sigma-54 dependent transcriptional regulator [Sinomicrobium weinanense]MBC9795401.1 sigma-54-dependent Fis family transcriptional regulator [Sinomicrobium weinanense]MBU3123926.1 sigma-54 dependent transcriptional regulator [Sinomicrobium weinanense]